ncbi:MAG: HlyD family type I secretion periplasmic adaptor subunit [Reyranella sp.]|uniref:HlyD family type I secretion periplasmic adaptor subunit n=1 Tax=Reyranella sp. TaxID=1929291 RepID=UPI00122603EC|nr:HlyD family type I secretion periplasmic adaptor subunit [Reyranella sp.]TAJ37334.1 MAG: HlyD family type I secretion periplasmic adaptor subunit [Reyranella sp.]
MSSHQSIGRHLVLGGSAIVLLIGGVGGWAVTTELSGAVIASGQLVVDSNVKKVQHPTGGVVGELRVREGDRVKAGDVVVRLDETQTRAGLAIVTKALDELAARQARSEAERDAAQRVAFPPDLLARAADPDVLQVMAGEQRLFEIRGSGREGLKSQLKEQVAQLEQQILGNREQEAAKAREIDWIQQELKGVRDLWSKNLVPFARVTTLERDGARLDGERGALIAAMAQTKGRIAEIQLKILQVDEDLRTEVGKELAEMRGKKSELIERRVAAEDQLKRVDLVAPQDGRVFQRSVHTIGGVIQAGEPVMLIVPDSDALIIEARIAPQEIDQVHVGQRAVVRFPAFNQRTTPELDGEIVRIGADVTQEEKKNESYYSVRILVPDSELARLQGLRLVAGMPVEVFMQTEPRTVLSYLVKPMQDQIAKAFRGR